MTTGIDAKLTVEGFDNIPRVLFNKRKMRRAFRQAGNVVAKRARRNISGSGSGYPAKRTGRMRKSLKVRVGSGGMYAKVAHVMPAPASTWRRDPRNQAFYPAFLFSGTSRGVRRHQNWIGDALAASTSEVRSTLQTGLLEALS
ncbi:HK97 gp10 family phage protein [Castellaniella sp. UC4442_H9]